MARVDHAGIVGHDVEAMRTAFQDAGFDVSPAAILRDRDGNSLGQTSAHILFADSYIELSAPLPGETSHLTPLVGDTMRLAILALRSDDLATDHARYLAQGLTGGPPRRAARPVGDATAHFAWFALENLCVPDVLVAIVEHLTPELVFAPAGFRHPNGARCLTDISLAQADSRIASISERGARLSVDRRLAPQESRLTVTTDGAPADYRFGHVMLRTVAHD